MLLHRVGIDVGGTFTDFVMFGLILSDKLIGKKTSKDKNIIFIPSWFSFLELI
ncbi:MAG: hypothetical protein IMZ51_00335 [Chloroflexi bacterium]|nr:hypothetical protein [Chloroflexota bacterium]MBE3114324.1 hypothetical protein [Actinomycetota bacterium]